MDKQQIIAFIEGQLATGKISKNDLALMAGVNMRQQDNMNRNTGNTPAKSVSSAFSVVNAFYIIGGIVATIGVVILLGSNWNEIGVVGRVLVTAGLALALYIVGLLLRQEHQRKLAKVCITLSALYFPFAGYVFVKEAGMTFSSGNQWLVALVLAVLYGVVVWVTRYRIVTLYVTGYLTWSFLALCAHLAKGSLDYDLLKYATMAWGLLLIGYAVFSGLSRLKSGKYGINVTEATDGVAKFTYFLGAGLFIGVMMTFGGAANAIVILPIFALFYLSTYVRSRLLLLQGSAFLVFHLIRLNLEYFKNSSSMATALIVIGFLVIGIGYATLMFDRKYIQNRV